jgi:phosphatidate cytidylyltransferase
MLKARVITALFLVAGLALVLFALPAKAADVAFALVAGLAAWEWGGLMRQDGPARWLYAVLILFFCWQLHFLVDELFPVFLGLAAGFWLLLVPFWLRNRWSFRGDDFIGYLVGIVVIVPTWVGMVVLHEASPWLLLAAMALVWMADVAAYFAGRRFGRHKLAPAISPGKTWEGVAGAVVGVVVYGVVLLVATPLKDHVPLNIALVLVLLLVLTALSIAGDLFESLLKRQAEIKDSSQLLPGHGGILDRIDSLTSTLPIVALLVLQWRA